MEINCSLCLAFIAKNILRDCLLVRKLKGIECATDIDTVIISSQINLAKPEMSLLKIWNKEFFDPKVILNSPIENHFFNSTVANNNAIIGSSGNLTDQSLLDFAEKSGKNIETLRSKEILRTFPFSSRRKRLGMILKDSDNYFLYEKGASELIINTCTSMILTDGSIISIDSCLKEEISNSIEKLNSEGFRTIAIAYKEIDDNYEIGELNSQNNVYKIENENLTLIAILGISRKLRMEAPLAIEHLKNSGKNVILVNGDNQTTLKIMANTVGITKDLNNDIIIEGQVLEQMIQDASFECTNRNCLCNHDNEEKGCKKKKLIKILKNLKVVSRCTPNAKLSIVTALQSIGLKVAVIGGELFDAPSLKGADLSFCNGISGSDIAKETSDIIILDDNLYSVSKSFNWFSTLKNNLRKNLIYSGNLSITIVLITIIGAIFYRSWILSPMQIFFFYCFGVFLGSFLFSTIGPENNEGKKEERNLITKVLFLSLK